MRSMSSVSYTHLDVYKRQEAYKQEFIKFMVESDVLKFGSFTLKSGRQSPDVYKRQQ